MKGKKGEEVSKKKIKVEWVGRETEQEHRRTSPESDRKGGRKDI